jgi:L-threonylcarbamoyladenylate synthase
VSIKTATSETINEATTLLRNGECVVIPTETVYGLAADATNGAAVAKIFEIKGRPTFNPLISHFYSVDHLQEFVDLNDDAKLLAGAFWAGAMTLIVNRRANCKISDVTCAGLETVAVRIPSHPTAQKIIKAAGVPLAAPSANASGEVSPTSATHVADSLGDKAPLIIADGSSEIGLESTVIDVTGNKAVILRHGSITADKISDVLGYDVTYSDGHDEKKPKSPGQLLKHYAPSTPVRLKAYDVVEGEALLAFGSTKFMPTDKISETHVINLSDNGDLYEAASKLFASLRALDKKGATTIAVMDIPNEGIGLAINDRLQRATEK